MCRPPTPCPSHGLKPNPELEVLGHGAFGRGIIGHRVGPQERVPRELPCPSRCAGTQRAVCSPEGPMLVPWSRPWACTTVRNRCVLLISHPVLWRLVPRPKLTDRQLHPVFPAVQVGFLCSTPRLSPCYKGVHWYSVLVCVPLTSKMSIFSGDVSACWFCPFFFFFF